MRSHLKRAATAAAVVALFGTASLAQNVRYVRADAPEGGNGVSWSTAFRTVYQAIGSSPPGTSIWIARGTYKPPSPAGIQLVPNVSLFGGFSGDETSFDQRDPVANPTILSGDLLGDDDIGGSTIDNGQVLIASPSILANTIVDGFTIRSGRASQGGGLRSMGSPLIRNCTFTRNNTELGSTNGAAVYLGFGGSTPPTPRIVNCRFTHNGNSVGSSFGVLLVEGNAVDARIVNCSFIANESTGAGIVGARNGAGATLVNCSVVSNTVRGPDGAAYLGPSTPSFLNLVNCTIAGNTCIDGGPAGLRVSSPSTPILVRNCILWGNTSFALPTERAQFSVPNTTTRLDYCRIEGWSGQYPGAGTSGADPLLMDIDGPDDLPGTGDEDVRLRPGSSAIDAANNFYVWPDIADLDADGNTDEPTPFDLSRAPRFLDDPHTPDTGVGTPPIADIGAYEFSSSSQPCHADFNADGVLNSQDFFDFLNAFFLGC